MISIVVPNFRRKYGTLSSLLHIYVHIRSVPGSVVRDPVSSRPSESERLSHRLIGPPSQSMYIMADLRKMDRYNTIESG